tara:strand:- start:578 stop:1135 length:558 start_codon:yes stop_codon:yes gene_type:complete
MKNSLLVLLLLLTLGCSSLQKINSDYIVLQRTPCFGSCPDYKLTLFENGNGIIKGSGFITKKEKIKFSISREAVDIIFSIADSVNFFSYPSNIDDVCVSEVSDMSGTFLTIKKSSEKKKVSEKECLVFYPDGYFKIESFYSEAELDSVSRQNEIAMKYLEGFYSIVNNIDSLSNSNVMIEKLIKK